ncbi:hypothetical protein GF420_05395 [candidate division GN15 bacterium]|nr:hypothetical protein [candidate division GN15 bacterium]
MKRYLWALAAFAVIGLLAATGATAGDWFNWGSGVKGSGDIVTETRDIENFERISSSGSFDIFVTVGPDVSLEIEFDDNLIELVETEVHGGTLHIDSRKSFRSRHNCNIRITVPTLERIKISGSGDAVVEQVTGKVFECKIAGSGDVRLEGEVDEVDISIAGSGDVDARRLKAKDVYATISGSGDIDVYASEYLDGRISGSGDIAYYGNPRRTNKSVAGSGDIRAR